MDLAPNTAVSFVTNTNWQSYSGETTLSYFSQMAGLTVQNFLSAASGIAVIFALIRAFTRQSMSTLAMPGSIATHHVMGARPCGVVDCTVFYSTRCAAKLSALSGCEYR
ncbi:potassium-transporting ATPase subunit KdpA [Shigella flexneri]